MPVREDGRVGHTFSSWYEQIKVGDLVMQACMEEDKDGNGELFGVLARVVKKSKVDAVEGSFRSKPRYNVWSRPVSWDADDVVDFAETGYE